MKTKKAKKSPAVILAALVFLSFGNLSVAASSVKNYPNIDWKQAELNYVAALASDNLEVRRSAAGFLGEYRITNANDPLINVLKHDKVECVRMAAALALMMIDTPAGRAAVEEASLYDGSDKVAKFCRSLLMPGNENISAAE